MKKLAVFIFVFFVIFSSRIFAFEDLSNKKFLCTNLLWGFDFISSTKVKIINTDINNESDVREYFYETDSTLPFINIYLMQNNIKEIRYSIQRETLRVDIWTMTSGGITTREIIPEGFCEVTNISNIFEYIEKLKN